MVLFSLEGGDETLADVSVLFVGGSGEDVVGGIFWIDGFGEVALAGVNNSLDGSKDGGQEGQEDDEEEEQFDIVLDEAEVAEGSTEESDATAPE